LLYHATVRAGRLTRIAPARLARDRSPSAALSEKMQAVTFGGIGLRSETVSEIAIRQRN
jgi:hypothetical protein